MTQEEIINYLKKRKKPVDMKELLINIPANRASISRGCKQLRKAREVKFVKKRIKSYEKFMYFL